MDSPAFFAKADGKSIPTNVLVQTAREITFSSLLVFWLLAPLFSLRRQAPLWRLLFSFRPRNVTSDQGSPHWAGRLCSLVAGRY